MHKTPINATLTAVVVLLLYGNAQAALIIDPPITITHQVTVQMIQTNDGLGTLATVFGDAGQQAQIFGFIDQIWAQAGIDINFLPGVTPDPSAFRFHGTPGLMDPRPSGDLGTILAAGPNNADPNVLNMYFVDIVPAFSFTSESSANGLAFQPGNGIAMFVGDTLLTFETGLEVIASVAAHEIGHNLGLPHLGVTENLMCGSGVTCAADGERLIAAQIATATGSPFAVVIPLPAAVWLFGGGIVMLVGVRRRTISER